MFVQNRWHAARSAQPIRWAPHRLDGQPACASRFENEEDIVGTIRQEDFIQSVADPFQFISYYHPVDYIRSLHEAYEREESPAAKDAMAQILINSRMAAE